MDDSIRTFVKSVKIGDCRIVNTPNLIFLCGGSTSDAGPILSARDYFHRYLEANEPSLARRIKLAEAINDWFDDDTFSDLLELEGYLADLSDLIVIFVESPGSIAELGAFAASDALRPKTLAVLNSTHPDRRTFIADGPVRRIMKADSGLIHYYEWNSVDLTEPSTVDEFADMAGDLSKLLISREHSAAKERKLDLNSDGHIMLLIADLVELFGITFGTELMDCLSEWGCNIDKKRLQRYVSLLEHLELINHRRKSNQTYFLTSISSGFILYDYMPGTKDRDRGRVKSLIRQALKAHDPRRTNIYDLHHSKKRRRRAPHV